MLRAAQVEALANFGRHLGAAYQIYDDCIDFAGRESVTGKTLGTDLRKGKMTLPMLRLLKPCFGDREGALLPVHSGRRYDSISLLLKTSGGSRDGRVDCQRRRALATGADATRRIA